MKEVVMRNRQHDFTTGKSCLTNLPALYGETADPVDTGRPMDVAYLDF